MAVEERVALEEAAIKWMEANNAGVRKALKQDQFSVFTEGQLKGAKARAATRARTGNLSANAGNRMLTHEEEEELVEWIIEKNLKLDGADTAEIGEKVLVILKARKVVLRALKSRRGQPLSTCAKMALNNQQVGADFFRGLRDRHGKRIKTGRSSNIDLKKAKKATYANAKKLLTTGSHSLYRELTELPDENGKPLVGTVHPVSGKIIRPIIDPNTGEFTPYAGPGTSDGRTRLLVDEIEAFKLIDPEDPSKVSAGNKLGYRMGSAAAAKMEIVALREALRRLTALPVLPKEMKVLDIAGEYVPPGENKNRRRYTQVDWCFERFHPPPLLVAIAFELHSTNANAYAICSHLRVVRFGGA